MKVLINAISAKMGGAKTMIISFLENIEENDGNEYLFLCQQAIFEKKLFIKKNVKIIETNSGNINHIRRFFWYQINLPKFVRTNKFDYMINLTNYGPVDAGCKEILLLHNSKHVSKEIKESLNFKNRVKLFFQDIVFKLSLKGATKLVVQTDYMKRRVNEKFGYPEEKIYIIPSTPRMIIDNLDEKLENEIQKFIGNEENVISNITLYAAHKNLELLLYAIKYIKDNSDCKVKLIITIDPTCGTGTKRLINMISELGIQNYVFSVGEVNNNNINQIFRRSKIFVFPSYAESFGIPFVEAMKFGLPIIAADLGFSHDVCDKAALYFKYNDSKQLAEKIIYLLTDNKKRLEMMNFSRERWVFFNEQNWVKKYIELLQ